VATCLEISFGGFFASASAAPLIASRSRQIGTAEEARGFVQIQRRKCEHRFALIVVDARFGRGLFEERPRIARGVRAQALEDRPAQLRREIGSSQHFGDLFHHVLRFPQTGEFDRAVAEFIRKEEHGRQVRAFDRADVSDARGGEERVHGALAGGVFFEERRFAFQRARLVGLAAIAGVAQQQAVPERLQFRRSARRADDFKPWSAAIERHLLLREQLRERGVGERGINRLQAVGELCLASFGLPLAAGNRVRPRLREVIDRKPRSVFVVRVVRWSFQRRVEDELRAVRSWDPGQ
jgi:hypothetical protein